jgi:hypothetical protein
LLCIGLVCPLVGEPVPRTLYRHPRPDTCNYAMPNQSLIWTHKTSHDISRLGTRLWAERPRNHISIPGGGNSVFPLPKHEDWLCSQPNLLFHRYLGFSNHGIKLISRLHQLHRL